MLEEPDTYPKETERTSQTLIGSISVLRNLDAGKRTPRVVLSLAGEGLTGSTGGGEHA